jgi:hypothetical protein
MVDVKLFPSQLKTLQAKKKMPHKLTSKTRHCDIMDGKEQIMLKNHPIYKEYYANENGEVFHNDYKMKTRINKYGYEDFNFYVPNRKWKKHYQVHRFVWECFNGVIEPGNERYSLTINHKDNNRVNNRLDNLEIMTRKQNLEMRKYPSKTGIRGITIHKDGGYIVRKYINDKRVYLGYYKLLDDAKNALEGG